MLHLSAPAVTKDQDNKFKDIFPFQLKITSFLYRVKFDLDL